MIKIVLGLETKTCFSLCAVTEKANKPVCVARRQGGESQHNQEEHEDEWCTNKEER